MEVKRSPFQGVSNIIRFNWHFYAIVLLLLLTVLLFHDLLPELLQPLAFAGALLGLITLFISLLVSYYVYDASDLYELNWLGENEGKNLLNINAGFDEISSIIRSKHPKASLSICDFYHPLKHTEISIKRARKAYPPQAESVEVSTEKLPFPNEHFDKVLAVLSAHEIRDHKERALFFDELNRITKADGNIYVTEHLRDTYNFLAYTIGFLHFHSKASWKETFQQADLRISQEIKTTPFITTFILEKNGNTT